MKAEKEAMLKAEMEAMSPFARLFFNMRRPRSHPEIDDETRQLVREQREIQDALADEFARQHGLTRVRGCADWWRIIGRTPNTRPADWNLPEDDHGELFVREGKPAAWVVHIYAPLSDARLRAMIVAADQYGLRFTVDARSWHYPLATLMVVWVRKDDPIGSTSGG